MRYGRRAELAPTTRETSLSSASDSPLRTDVWVIWSRTSNTVAASTKAFVMGLKSYTGNNKLKCSVNDAVDMAERLHDGGAAVTLIR